jgi:hypothetical protein
MSVKQPETPLFVTDDQIIEQLARIESRIRQLANGFTDLQTRIPAAAREAVAISDQVAKLRQLLTPRGG